MRSGWPGHDPAAVGGAASSALVALPTITAAAWLYSRWSAQAVAPGMKQSGGGVILNLRSISWHLGLAGLVVYQTCKASIEGLTRALARDFGEGLAFARGRRGDDPVSGVRRCEAGDRS